MQSGVYDRRNRGASIHAQRQGFALQLIYRRELLLEALRALCIDFPTGEEIWAYIGGGEGTQCMELSRCGGRHVSVDVSLTQLRLGRQLIADLAPRLIRGMRPEAIGFVRADGEGRLPLSNGVARVAYGIGVLNHLNPDAWRQHLRELMRIVQPGGHVFQVVPNLACEVFSRPVFTRQFADSTSMQYWTQFVTESRVADAFASAGLVDIRSTTLWRLDHDQCSRFLRRPEGLVARLLAHVDLNYTYPLSRAVQALFRAGADRGRVWARSVTFDQPRHIAIAGTVPSP